MRKILRKKGIENGARFQGSWEKIRLKNIKSCLSKEKTLLNYATELKEKG